MNNRVVVTFFISLTIAPLWVQGDDVADLRYAQSKVADNLARILTWRGKIDAVENGHRPQVITRFVYSSDGNRVRYDSELLQVNDTKVFFGGMRTRDSYCRANPYVEKENTTLPEHTRSITIEGLAAESRGIFADFDPYFYIGVQRDRPDEWLEAKIRRLELNLPSSATYRASKQDDGTVTVVSEPKHGTPGKATFVFSGMCGGMPILTDGIEGPPENPSYRTRIENKYILIDDVWLPERTSYYNKSPQREFQVEVHWKEHRLNEPIGESEFTIEAFGLKPGNLIRDRRTGDETRVDESEFVRKFRDEFIVVKNPAQKPRQQLTPSGRSGATFFLIVGNVIVLFLFVLYFLRFRRR